MPKSYNARENPASYAGTVLSKMLVTFLGKQTCSYVNTTGNINFRKND